MRLFRIVYNFVIHMLQRTHIDTNMNATITYLL